MVNFLKEAIQRSYPDAKPLISDSLKDENVPESYDEYVEEGKERILRNMI